ncbi:MAG: hypothetical protein K2J83_03075 [Clostridia bacterium]|nr:hypothetical protein [Clostridia bacterium]
MKKINLKIAPTAFKNPTVKIDGEIIPFKKQKTGGYSAEYSTEKDSVELTVNKVHEMNGKLWFLWSALFFILGCFGIFDPHYDSRCQAVEFRLKLDLNNVTDLTLHFANFTEGGRAIDCVRNCNAEEVTNYYYTDRKAKKRLKIFRIIKPFVWLAIVALAIFGVVKLIIG